MSRVYIVILNWNSWKDTIDCLNSLLMLDYSPYTILLCDNGSCDDSMLQFKEWADQHEIEYAEMDGTEAEYGGNNKGEPKLIIINNGRNMGFAGGNNVGLRYALARNDFEYVWLLNNDTVVDPAALSSLLERMEVVPEAGICGSTIRYFHNPDRVQALGGGYHCRWLGLPWHYGRFLRPGQQIDAVRAEAWMNYVEGASMLVSHRFLQQIGLLCEEYFLYFEETDWAVRALKKFSLAYAPKSIVYHKVGASIGTSSNPLKKSLFCDYFSSRNRLFFTSRFYPYALPAIYLTLIGAILVRLICGKWDHAVMIGRTMRDYRDIDHRYVPGVCHE